MSQISNPHLLASPNSPALVRFTRSAWWLLWRRHARTISALLLPLLGIRRHYPGSGYGFLGDAAHAKEMGSASGLARAARLNRENS